LKIAIMGFGPTQKEAPWGDSSWEKWGLPWCYNWTKYDRLFEMHSWDVLRLKMPRLIQEYWTGSEVQATSHRPDKYAARLLKLAQSDKKLYMHKGVPGIEAYPFDKVIPLTGDYFISSISYMLALAIAEMSGDADDTIGLWGVDCDGEGEWAYQRANNEYFIGLAKGKGIKIVIPKGSSLLRFSGGPVAFGGVDITYSKRYGLLGKEPQEFKRRVILTEAVTEISNNGN